MINLFDKFDTASLDFLRSQIIAQIKIPSVAIEDDGFLPVEVDSPFRFYCGDRGNKLPLYFDQLPLPNPYWRIEANSQYASVMDMDKKRADIFYSSTDNSRRVKEVHWLDELGQVSWIDHYNQHGHLFAKTYINHGTKVLRKYFTVSGKEVIDWNIAAGDLELRTKEGQRHFTDIADFVAYYLKKRHYKLEHIFYNSLNTSLTTSLHLDVPGTDTLFWHEKTGDELPGNMQFLMKNQTRTKHIVFQRFTDWQEKKAKLEKAKSNVDFRYLGTIYPHPRGNSMRPNILILTNSDQIEQLAPLVQGMPNLHFKIAAITEMSSKLMAFNRYSNVELFPTASISRIKQLIKDCDIYMDINHGNEILDAVRGAFEQNMLIVGFKNTLHRPLLLAPENIFDPSNVDGMKQRIMTALIQPRLMEQLIDHQRQVAGDVTIKDYQRVMGELRNE